MAGHFDFIKHNNVRLVSSCVQTLALCVLLEGVTFCHTSLEWRHQKMCGLVVFLLWQVQLFSVRNFYERINIKKKKNGGNYLDGCLSSVNYDGYHFIIYSTHRWCLSCNRFVQSYSHNNRLIKQTNKQVTALHCWAFNYVCSLPDGKVHHIQAFLLFTVSEEESV